MFNRFRRRREEKKQEKSRPNNPQKEFIQDIIRAIDSLPRKKLLYVNIYLAYKRADQSHMHTDDGKRRFRKIRKRAIKQLANKQDPQTPYNIAMEIWRLAHNYITFNKYQLNRDSIINNLEEDPSKYQNKP
jgi:hypothetical protein